MANLFEKLNFAAEVGKQDGNPAGEVTVQRRSDSDDVTRSEIENGADALTRNKLKDTLRILQGLSCQGSGDSTTTGAHAGSENVAQHKGHSGCLPANPSQPSPPHTDVVAVSAAERPEPVPVLGVQSASRALPSEPAVSVRPKTIKKAALPRKKPPDTATKKQKRDEDSAKSSVPLHRVSEKTENCEKGEPRRKAGSSVSPREQNGKKKKAAKRERNSSGSTDARAAYLPLSKPFVIPRKKVKQDLLQEVSLTSREYLKDILPIISKQYRSKDASNRFNFTKAHLIHNEELTRMFLERRKEMKEEGRTDKELMESYAFMATDTRAEAEKICQEGVSAPGGHVSPLGNSNMGVYLSRYSDIIKREGFVSGHQGILILLKILKGKVKARPLNYTNVLDPVPNYDSHIAKANTMEASRLNSLQTPVAFDTYQIYLYEFGDLDMVKRPRNVCPYAMVHFTYHESAKPSAATQAPIAATEKVNPVIKAPAPMHNHHQHHSTPPLPTPLPPPPTATAKPDALPVTPHHSAPTQDTMDKTKPMPTPADIEKLRKESFVIWEGTLSVKTEHLCSARLVSFTSPVLPQILPAVINFRTKMSFSKLHSLFPSGLFASGIPLTSSIREVCRRNKYVVYCELQHSEESLQRYQNLMEFMADKKVVLKCRVADGVTMYVLPTSSLSMELGVTKGDYPQTLHVLFVSRTPMVGHITEKGVHISQETKIGKAVPDNRLLEMSSNKQLMLRIGLQSMFTRQTHDLKHQVHTSEPCSHEAGSSPATPKAATPSNLIRTPLSADRASGGAVSEKSTIIDYQHGYGRKDLTPTNKQESLEPGLGLSDRSPLPSEVKKVHPMYSSPVSTLNLQADTIPESSLHPMYNISETATSPATAATAAVASAGSVLPASKQAHPMYSPQHQQLQPPFVNTAVGQEDTVHSMYSQQSELSRPDQIRPDQISPRPVLSRQDPRTAFKNLLSPSQNPAIAGMGNPREPPMVSRTQGKLPLNCLLDQQKEISQLQEEVRALRRLRETSSPSDQALESLYTSKLSKLQDILSALRQERNRLNPQQPGAQSALSLVDALPLPPATSEMTMDQDQRLEERGFQRLGSMNDSLEILPSTETSQDVSGVTETPELSSKVLEVVKKIAKMPSALTSQSDTDVSVETLKEALNKVLGSSPSTKEKASDTPSSSQPLLTSASPSADSSLMMASGQAEVRGHVDALSASDQKGVENKETIDCGQGERAPSTDGGERGLPQDEPPTAGPNPFGDALTSMDQYSVAKRRPTKKLKRSQSREVVSPPPPPPPAPSHQDASLPDSEEKEEATEDREPDERTTEGKPLSLMERLKKEGMSLETALAKSSLEGQRELGSPIRGASEMKAFLNGKVGAGHTRDRIISAVEMKSYLNKKLQEAEHEKLDKGRRGVGGGIAASSRRGRGAVSSTERTIAEIDNEIRRLNKEKERLKIQSARKRNGSGDKSQQKLPFIRSMDFSSVGRIPKKKGASTEDVEASLPVAKPSETPAEKPASSEGIADDSTDGDARQKNSSSDGSSDSKDHHVIEVEGSHGRPDIGVSGDGTAVPYCPRDKTSYYICPEELQLTGGREKGVLLKGQDSHGRPIYAVALTKKYLQGGLAEEKWSGASLSHCVNDVLHRGARGGSGIETEEESQFSRIASAATKKVLSRQLKRDVTGRQVIADDNQNVTFNSAQSLLVPQWLSGNKAAEEIPTLAAEPTQRLSNGSDAPLARTEDHGTPADSQEAVSRLSLPSVPASTAAINVSSTTDSRVVPEQAAEQTKQECAGRPAGREGLIINDGACFLGDLESEDGVSVNFGLDEEAGQDRKSPTDLLPNSYRQVCEGPAPPDMKENKARGRGHAKGQKSKVDSAAGSEEILPPSRMASTGITSSLASEKSLSRNEKVDNVRDLNKPFMDSKDVPSSQESYQSSPAEQTAKSEPPDAKIHQLGNKEGSSASWKSDSSLKASMVSQRHHPYTRKEQKPRARDQEWVGPRYSQHLPVPELHRLMENYTVAAYKDRKTNRHVEPGKEGQAGFYSRPRSSAARFKDVEFRREKAEESQESQPDAKDSAKVRPEEQGQKRSHLEQLEKTLEEKEDEEEEDDKTVSKLTEEAFHADMSFYKDVPKTETNQPEPSCQEAETMPDALEPSPAPSPSPEQQQQQQQQQPTVSRRTRPQLSLAKTEPRSTTINEPAAVVTPAIRISAADSRANISVSNNSSSNISSSNNIDNINFSSSNNNISNNINFSSSNDISNSSEFFSSSCTSNSRSMSNVNDGSFYSSSSSSGNSSISWSNVASSRPVGPADGNICSQWMGGRDMHLDQVTASQEVMSHQQISDNLNFINNVSSIPASLVSIINQHLMPTTLPPSQNESYLLSSSINASRDPRIRRQKKPVQPPTPTQTDPAISTLPSTTSLPSYITSLPAFNQQQASLSSSGTASIPGPGPKAPAPSKLPSLRDKPSRSILKGSRRQSSPPPSDATSVSSCPPVEQTSDNPCSDASKKIKISLSQYKEKVEPKPKTMVEELQEHAPPHSVQPQQQTIALDTDINQTVLQTLSKINQCPLGGISETALSIEDKLENDKADQKTLKESMEDTSSVPKGSLSIDTAGLSGFPGTAAEQSSEIRTGLEEARSHEDCQLFASAEDKSATTTSSWSDFLSNLPNLLVTVLRENSEEPGSELEDCSVRTGGSNGEEEEGCPLPPGWKTPEAAQMSLDTNMTIALLELEDSVFNIAADALSDTNQSTQPHSKKHFTKLSPSSVNRQLQNIKYELDAFWSQLRSLDPKDLGRVDEAKLSDPRHLMREAFPRHDKDLTLTTTASILADISSQLSNCLRVDGPPSKQVRTIKTAQRSMHLPKLAKLSEGYFTPRINGRSAVKEARKRSSLDEIVWRIQEEFQARLERVCSGLTPKLNPELETEKELYPMASLQSRQNLMTEIQQMLTAARNQSSKKPDALEPDDPEPNTLESYTQKPYTPETNVLEPIFPEPSIPEPNTEMPYTQTSYTQTSYTQTPYTQTPYTQTPYTQTPYTQTPYTQTPYTQTPYTQTPYTQTPYTQTPYTQTPYTQTPYTQTPYTQTPYTQTPYTQTLYTKTPYTQTPYTQTPYTLETNIPEPNTEMPYTQKLYTPEPITPEPNIPEPNIPEPNIPEPNIPEPNLLEPNIPEPNIPEPNIPEPNIPEPNLLEPNIPEPNNLEPTISKPNIPVHSIPEPNTLEPNILEPDIPEPNTLEPNIPEPTSPKPLTLLCDAETCPTIAPIIDDSQRTKPPDQAASEAQAPEPLEEVSDKKSLQTLETEKELLLAELSGQEPGHITDCPDQKEEKELVESSSNEESLISAASSPLRASGSCKWGKFTMKLWGKRPTKQRKTMKATWIKTEKPKKSDDTMADTLTDASEDMQVGDDSTLQDTKSDCMDEKKAGADACDGRVDGTSASKPEPSIESKETKLSSLDEQAVEDLCAKLMDEGKPRTKQTKVAGTIPILLNRSTSHASGSFKSAFTSKPAAKSGNTVKPKSPVGAGFNPQPTATPYQAGQALTNQPHPAQNFNMAQYSQYSSSSSMGCPLYRQQSQNNPSFGSQLGPSSHSYGPVTSQQNSIQTTYSGNGYGNQSFYPGTGSDGSNMTQGNVNGAPIPRPNNYGPNNMGYGPANMSYNPANMCYNPANMGYNPANMGYGSSNMGYGPSNMGFGPTNMGSNCMTPCAGNQPPLGPNAMGPTQNNMQVPMGCSDLNNMQAGYGSQYNGPMTPGSYTVGPRPPLPTRPQPPVPGMESDVSDPQKAGHTCESESGQRTLDTGSWSLLKDDNQVGRSGPSSDHVSLERHTAVDQASDDARPTDLLSGDVQSPSTPEPLKSPTAVLTRNSEVNDEAELSSQEPPSASDDERKPSASRKRWRIHSDGSRFGCKVIPGHLLDDFSPPSDKARQVVKTHGQSETPLANDPGSQSTSPQPDVPRNAGEDPMKLSPDHEEAVPERSQLVTETHPSSDEVSMESISPCSLQTGSDEPSSEMEPSGGRLESPCWASEARSSPPTLPTSIQSSPYSSRVPSPMSLATDSDSEAGSLGGFCFQCIGESPGWQQAGTQSISQSRSPHQALDHPLSACPTKVPDTVGDQGSSSALSTPQEDSCLSTDGSCLTPSVPSTPAPASPETDPSPPPGEESGQEPISDEQSVDRQDDCGNLGGTCILPLESPRGIVVPDELLLMTCLPDDLKALCEALQDRTSKDGSRCWKMLIRSEIVVKLDQVRHHTSHESLLSHQAYHVLKLLSQYRSLGVIHLLPCRKVDPIGLPVQLDYLQGLRVTFPNPQQCNCVLLTDTTFSDSEVERLRASKVSACNMSSLLMALNPEGCASPLAE